MAPQPIFISALNRESGKAKLHVRATRIWEAIHFKKLLNTKVIFVDEEETQIMVTIWNNQKPDYFPLLKEGLVYNISDFKVVANTKEYRAVDGELAFNFYHNTRVQPTEDTDRIPRYKFNLTNFEDVPALLWAKKNFIDIIGMVKNYGHLNPALSGAKKLEILLVNNRQKEMIVNLWEDKAVEFQEGLTTLHGTAAFVVITGLLAKQYSGTPVILSSGDATKTYFNIDYSPLKELKNNIMASTGHTSDTLLPPTKKQFVTTEENTLKQASIKEILEAQISDSKQILRFICEATIIDVSKYDGWYYNACPKCPKKIRVDNDKFFCDNCSVETNGFKQRYRVTVGVKDDSAKTTFTLFNKEAERLIGVPIESIISEIGQDKITENIPPMVNNVIGKKCAFEIKVTSFNRDGRDGYTVARISEVANSTSTTQINASNDEAGPNKKQKVA